MPTVSPSFLAVGGNRHPSAADWKGPGLFVFGAGNNVAICSNDATAIEGNQDLRISALLTGHTDIVNAVQIWTADATTASDTENEAQKTLILSGAADHSIRVWESGKADTPSRAPASTTTGAPATGTATASAGFTARQTLGLHSASVTTLATLPQAGLFVSGSADATIGVWSVSGADLEVRHVQTITLKPRVLPLACALWQLESGAVVLAVAGTSAVIKLYVRASSQKEFELQATLTGHEGWIRSLDFTCDGTTEDVLLASASQDKYIRLWRFRRSSNEQVSATADGLNGDANPTINPVKKSLSNRSQQVGNAGCSYDVTFEALLIGHEDWIYTAKWSPIKQDGASPILLSASADNSLALWSADESSGLWICHTRLGEISSQKGSTTATGSTGGFWIGLWQPNGQGVISLGRTGSWRRWKHNLDSDIWEQRIGSSGHVEDVRGLAWAPDGSYLLSTSADQTTRVFAEWKRKDGATSSSSWHEFARPQIHGYDLNCIAALTPNQFTSGADEKLLRVFNKPRAIAELLSNLSGSTRPDPVDETLPDAANIPVLGLSNKAITTTNGSAAENDGNDDAEAELDPSGSEALPKSSPLSALTHPPLEDNLSRQTLWPEHEKLYGHGYEISAVAASSNAGGGQLLATACKASSLEHAVIRLYSAGAWREIRPALEAHSLTVTALQFSPSYPPRTSSHASSANGSTTASELLLSVGRDRRWVVWERRREEGGEGEGGGGAAGAENWKIAASHPKGHSRMILDCSWAPASVGRVFATAGRDKVVRIWRLANDEDGRDGDAGRKVECVCTLSAEVSVTAVAFALEEVVDAEKRAVWLGYGTESGGVQLAVVDCENWSLRGTVSLDVHLRPSKAVNVLCWRPRGTSVEAGSAEADGEAQLAVGSEDCSVRIFDVVR